LECGGERATSERDAALVFPVTGRRAKRRRGGYTLVGGFWALPQVVQTPGTPTLYLAHAAPGPWPESDRGGGSGVRSGGKFVRANRIWNA
jgi:hypothetical protein